MTSAERNIIFEDYMNMVRYTVNHHRSMLKILRMDAEDLTQELAICLLKAIERYEPDRGAKPSTYYFKSLRYGVLNLWREQRRAVRVANLQAVSLTRSVGHGAGRAGGNCGGYRGDSETSEMDIAFTVDYDDALMVGEFLETLSQYERALISRKMHGYEPDDRRHGRFMKIIKRKAARFCAAGGLA